MSELNLKDKQILMVIAHKDFRDEEYFIPLTIFQQAGIKVITAGSKKGTAVGVLGGEAEITLTLKDIKSEDFDAIVFIGGNGAQEYFENAEAHRIAIEFNDAKKIVGAICIAPVILAKAGILKEKTATVWQNELDKTGTKALLKAGCKFTGSTVETSKNIITANGRDAAKEFALEIMEALQYNDKNTKGGKPLII